MNKVVSGLLALTVLFAGCVQPPVNDENEDSNIGTIIEGPGFMEQARYEPFTKQAYEDALASGKVVYLEFYANWCPICAAQAPEIEAAFKELPTTKVSGFRVNYNDSETDEDEKNLARQFGITYQHTHVILDSNGSLVKKSLEVWDKETIISEVRKAYQ